MGGAVAPPLFSCVVDFLWVGLLFFADAFSFKSIIIGVVELPYFSIPVVNRQLSELFSSWVSVKYCRVSDRRMESLKALPWLS